MRSAARATVLLRLAAQRVSFATPLPVRAGEAARMAAAAEEAVAAATGSGEWEVPTRVLRALTWLGQEFMSDWEAQDLRAALFQLLLLWLLVSLLGIQVAWRVYGNTVTGLYYRQGPGGQNGGTPDGSSHFSMWESSSNETMKTHRE